MSNKPDFVNKVFLHPCKDEVRLPSTLSLSRERGGASLALRLRGTGLTPSADDRARATTRRRSRSATRSE